MAVISIVVILSNNYILMGKHTEWRKMAKKMCRKRRRQNIAIKRDAGNHIELSPSHLQEIKQQEELEEIQNEEKRKELEQQYWEREHIAQLQWQELQKKLELAREERTKQKIKIQEEWQHELDKLNEMKKEAEALQERQAKLAKLQEDCIDEFLDKGGEIPEELIRSVESNPSKPPCPFFTKTAACRYGDLCSRNHIKPMLSSIMVIKNFYSHYSLDLSENEHGDVSLEYDSHELYSHFEEFFNDIVPELENYGKIIQLKICCNKEPHLRGNVYVEYADSRDALRSYRRFHGRFYAGKQLNVEFCTIAAWSAAVCGLFFRKRCPKGNVCNFLHVFRNPKNLYVHNETPGNSMRRLKPSEIEIDRGDNDRDKWRWSESPEPVVRVTESRRSQSRRSSRSSRRRTRSRSRERKHSSRHRESVKRKRRRS